MRKSASPTMKPARTTPSTNKSKNAAKPNRKSTTVTTNTNKKKTNTSRNSRTVNQRDTRTTSSITRSRIITTGITRKIRNSLERKRAVTMRGLLKRWIKCMIMLWRKRQSRIIRLMGSQSAGIGSISKIRILKDFDPNFKIKWTN